jgi:hypothetical protein
MKSFDFFNAGMFSSYKIDLGRVPRELFIRLAQSSLGRDYQSFDGTTLQVRSDCRRMRKLLSTMTKNKITIGVTPSVIVSRI